MNPEPQVVANHMWIGKREWGINPSDDKPCVVCQVPRGQHKNTTECKAVMNIEGQNINCDLGFPHYPLAHGNTEHHVIWMSHSEHTQMMQDGYA